MTYVQANTNGKLHPATEPSLSPLNRGFLYGDAIYEVWRTYDQVIFAWDEHWARLERSAEALFLSLPITQRALLIEIQRTVAEYRARSGVTADVYIRLQITRGAGAIGLDIALADASDYVILVQPNPQLSTEKLTLGQRLSIATSLRRNSPAALNPAWKTGNYLNNILCLREARARGADEVVVTNLQGEITEAAVSNIGFVKAGAVITPPLSAGILEGVTRGLLIDSVAARAGLVIKEATVRPEDLPSLEECFLLSTTKDVSPVHSIDEHRFHVSEDSVTSRLKRAFQSYVADYLIQHRSERSVAARPAQPMA
ncbi:MAG TPA: aminotransferase class IV [Opitutaceae bacterium]|nr:aminotransferase class IV [Opitutaceae bacterium]